MFHVEATLDDEVLIQRLCGLNPESRCQYFALAIGRRHALTST